MLRKIDKIQIFSCGVTDCVQIVQDVVQLWSLIQGFETSVLQSKVHPIQATKGLEGE
jgi:hypothetical protein